MKNHRTFLMILILSVSILGLSTQVGPTEAQTGVTLKVLVSDQQAPIIQQRVTAFVAANDEVDAITVIEAPSRADDQHELLVTTFTTGSDAYDIVLMDVIWPGEFAANDWLVDLSDIWNATEQAKYLDAHVEAGTYGGKVVGSPFFFDSGLLLYRTDILARNGFTIADFETWSDFNVSLNAILDNKTEIEVNDDLEGYVFQGDAYEGGVVNLVEWMGASKGTFLNAAGTAANFAASAEPALTWWKSLIAPRYTTALNNTETNAVAERSELIGDEGSAVTKWIAGNAVFQRNWPFSYSNSLKDEFLNGSTAGDGWPADTARFGVTSLPYNETLCGVGNTGNCRTAVLGGSLLGIPHSSANIEEAKLFLQEIASFDAQLEMLEEQGNFPALKAVYNDTYLTPANGLDWVLEFSTNVFPNVLPRPVHPEYSAMSTAIQPLFHAALSGVTKIKTALEIMDEEVNIILGEAPFVSTIVTTISGVKTTILSTITEDEGPAPGIIMLLFSFMAITITVRRFKAKS
ncbi:MAG: extracellular solute-binding protein [Candidatus Kariarchaeaceae archaeon]|jgi:trehalose/maltose transport system substrate-binding protein